MKTPKEKANELIAEFKKYSWISSVEGYKQFSHLESARYCAIICCKEVLGYMGADRGYEFWTSVLYELEHYEG